MRLVPHPSPISDRSLTPPPLEPIEEVEEDELEEDHDDPTDKNYEDNSGTEALAFKHYHLRSENAPLDGPTNINGYEAGTSDAVSTRKLIHKHRPHTSGIAMARKRNYAKHRKYLARGGPFHAMPIMERNRMDEILDLPVDRWNSSEAVMMRGVAKVLELASYTGRGYGFGDQ